MSWTYIHSSDITQEVLHLSGRVSGRSCKTGPSPLDFSPYICFDSGEKREYINIDDSKNERSL